MGKRVLTYARVRIRLGRVATRARRHILFGGVLTTRRFITGKLRPRLFRFTGAHRGLKLGLQLVPIRCSAFGGAPVGVALLRGRVRLLLPAPRRLEVCLQLIPVRRRPFGWTPVGVA
ncbi:hypothetical protein ACLESO_56060, partial [Pyxidicoccus sp. 3LG]